MVTDKAAVPESAAAAEPPVDLAKDDRALQEAKKSDEERVRQNALDKEFLPAVGAGLHILHDDKLGTTCITLALKLTTTYLFFAYVSEGQQPASANGSTRGCWRMGFLRPLSMVLPKAEWLAHC